MKLMEELLRSLREANQCDGCRRALPVDEKGIHRDDKGLPVMTCQRGRYERDA